MPADDRAHRLAIRSATLKGNTDAISKACDRWQTAEHVGLAVPERHGKFGGFSQLRMVVHAFAPSGEMIIAGNFGIHLITP